MNNNLIIGILVAIVLLGVGYLLWGASGGGGSVATSTSPTTYTPPNSNPTPTPNNPGPRADAPSVVTNSSVAPSNSTAVVTGRVTPNGAQTTYWYEYGRDTSLGNRTSAQAIGSGFTSIPSPGYITGLQANTLYYFRLSAQNAYGTTNGTTYSFSTNNNPPPPSLSPSVSTNAATDVARTSATLNAHVNPRGTATTFWFEYGGNTNLGNITALSDAGSGSVSEGVSAALTGLNPSTKYYFRVNAQNQFGTVSGAIQSFTTKGPPSPGAPSVDTTSATNVATSTATLNGRVSPNGAQTSYWFEYGEDSLLGRILGTVTASQDISADASTLTVSATATGLNDNTRYFYRLVASNSYGTARGDIVNFKTRP